MLTDINTGRFNGAHSPKLFVEMYAPQVRELQASDYSMLHVLLSYWQMRVCPDNQVDWQPHCP